jgi:hypothetical protein
MYQRNAEKKTAIPQLEMNPVPEIHAGVRIMVRTLSKDLPLNNKRILLFGRFEVDF